MIEPLVILGAACLLEASETRLEATRAQLVERVELTVLARGPCHTIDLVLPAGVTDGRRRARLKLGDGSGGRLEDARFERLGRRADGEATLRLHVPELVSGDRVRVELERHWPADRPYLWRPGADRARVATLRTKRVDPRVVGEEVEAGHRELWVADPGPEAYAQVLAPGHDPGWPAPAAEEGMPVDEALERAAALRLLPQGADAVPVVGDAALARGAVDDRGFARTLLAWTAGGPDEVVLGRWLDGREVALWRRPDGDVALRHPDEPVRTGHLETEAGRVQVTESRDAETSFSAEPAPSRERTLTVTLPPGDPQVGLWPGGGSTLTVEDRLRVPASERATVWGQPLPPEAGGVVASGAELVEGPGQALLVLPASDEPAEARLRWQQPDAPACGELPEGWRVEAPGGEVVVDPDGAGWHLASWGGRPVLPGREALIAALDHRFRSLSLPEPGLPLAMKNRRPGWDAAVLFREALFERARPADLPQPAGWPRRIHKARGSGIVTPLEAALIVRAYALQTRMPADWVLVRPAPLGPGPDVCAEGYPEALVRLRWEGEERWIDPSCTACAPFELRPDLEGADALGVDVYRTPEPSPGAVRVASDGRIVRWTLEGPAALQLRLALADVPQQERVAWLARELGGPDATLRDVTGVTEPGAPIAIELEGAEPVDPLALPLPATEDGSRWLDWVGERRWKRPAEAADGQVSARRSVHTRTLRYQRTSADGRVEEVLEVRERRVPAADAEAVLRAREGEGAEPEDGGEGEGETDRAPEADPDREGEPERDREAETDREGEAADREADPDREGEDGADRVRNDEPDPLPDPTRQPPPSR